MSFYPHYRYYRPIVWDVSSTLEVERRNGVPSRGTPLRFAPSFCELISKDGLTEWATLDPDIPSDCAKERETMDRIHNYLKSAGHPVSHWYYGHFHQSWNSEIDGILFSMLDIMEFKEIH